jgi:hypothetical protein
VERALVGIRQKKLRNDVGGEEVVKPIDYRTIRTVASLMLRGMNWLIGTIHSSRNELEEHSYRVEEGSA